MGETKVSDMNICVSKQMKLSVFESGAQSILPSVAAIGSCSTALKSLSKWGIIFKDKDTYVTDFLINLSKYTSFFFFLTFLFISFVTISEPRPFL